MKKSELKQLLNKWKKAYFESIESEEYKEVNDLMDEILNNLPFKDDDERDDFEWLVATFIDTDDVIIRALEIYDKVD